MSLDNFVQRSRPLPKPTCTSRSIQDRDSMFVATLFRVTSPADAMIATKHLKNVIHGQRPADHESMAYRVMTLKSGRTGLNGPDDFEVEVGFDDDGENYAGKRILDVMGREGIMDAVIIVSRWFGGTLLGPIRIIEELQSHLEQLQCLDQTLGNLRSKLALMDGAQNPQKSIPQDYSSLLESLDTAKARRLIKARESAIARMHSIIEKKQEVVRSQVSTTNAST